MVLTGIVIRGKVYGVELSKWRIRLLNSLEKNEVLRRKNVR